MKESPFIVNFKAENEGQNLKELGLKYLPYWPWFLVAVAMFIGLGVLYMRYTPRTFNSTAKIRIIDESREANLAQDPAQLIGLAPRINLENEIEVLRSHRMLAQVVQALQLDVRYYQQGNIKTSEIWEPPFVVEKALMGDSLPPAGEFEVRVEDSAFHISAEEREAVSVPFNQGLTAVPGYPFSIRLRNGMDVTIFRGITYEIRMQPIREAVVALEKDLEVYPSNKDSDILSLSLTGESQDKNEAVLNMLIEKFNQDGIEDRQLVSKRTLEVIDDRFVYLTQELDSIESGKEDFKQANNLAYIEADAGITLQQKAESEDEVLVLENQLELANLLLQNMQEQGEGGLLPANIGLENANLNTQISDYNEVALQRAKMLPNVGLSHPTLQTLSGQLERARTNIMKSVNVYQAQLNSSLEQLNRRSSLTGARYALLPEKERTLRAIERQQSIKEKLFLILLEKREEAAINVAATAPSVKIVDQAITNPLPVSPRKAVVYPLSLALGVMVPFLFLFVRFSLDSKLRNRTDIEQAETDIPLLGELPLFKEDKVFMGLADRSVLSEAFRMLCTNLHFRLPKKEVGQAQVVFVSSAIKGEGKTLVALNTSLALSCLKKRVLLVGADLRNPQLHQYLKVNKRVPGLAEYLEDPHRNWRECVQEGDGPAGLHEICYSSRVPPSAPELLAGNAFSGFLTKARGSYDYIVVDTAPTLLVSDTLLVSELADITLFVLRAGHTEKRILEFAKELQQGGKLKNMAFVLNEADHGQQKRYNYGHTYGYTVENES